MNLHTVRIRFGTFSYDKLTKGVKANLMKKFSHFGGTAGLCNGFSVISVFEFFAYGVSLLIILYKFIRQRGETNVESTEETQPKEIKEKTKDEERLERLGKYIDSKIEALERKNDEKYDALLKKLIEDAKEFEAWENDQRSKLSLLSTHE